jgi:hypothetical protein
MEGPGDHGPNRQANALSKLQCEHLPERWAVAAWAARREASWRDTPSTRPISLIDAPSSGRLKLLDGLGNLSTLGRDVCPPGRCDRRFALFQALGDLEHGVLVASKLFAKKGGGFMDLVDRVHQPLSLLRHFDLPNSRSATAPCEGLRSPRRGPPYPDQSLARLRQGSHPSDDIGQWSGTGYIGPREAKPPSLGEDGGWHHAMDEAPGAWGEAPRTGNRLPRSCPRVWTARPTLRLPYRDQAADRRRLGPGSNERRPEPWCPRA